MEAYFIIYDFMVKDLHLSGNELLIYALIFCFTIKSESGCYASQSAIASRIGVTRETANRCLQALCKKGLIEERRGGRRTKTYLLKNLTGDVTNRHTYLLKNITATCNKTSHNNKSDIKIDIYNDKKRAHCKSAPSFDIDKYNAFVDNFELKYPKEVSCREG